jgi:Uma2 family endonuclease
MSHVLENPIISKNLYEFTIEKYHELSESGLLPRNLELVFGGIVNKMTISPIHAKVVNKARRIISENLPEHFTVRQESPVTIQELNSEPEPDLCIVNGNEDDYTFSHPTTAVWIIEVSNTTIELDRAKKKIYATANVPTYWIINLTNKEIEVYTNPDNGDYKSETTYWVTDSILLPKPLTISICLADLL